jgi:Cft2 family RNA processing exonuclease
MRIDFTPEGIRLPEIGLWLDPVDGCDLAWVSHGHSDHARGTHCRVLATPETLEIYRIRFCESLAPSTQFQPLPYGESLDLGGARLTSLPAGHILGSAQLLIEAGGERIVYTGDFKLRAPICAAAATVEPCDRLIVESTFGLPIFHLLDTDDARARILAFARECLAEDVAPAYIAHPLGRGQEVLHVLCEAGIPTAVHGAIARFLPVYEAAKFRFPGWMPYQARDIAGKALVVAHGFQKVLQAAAKSVRIAYVSGWARLDNARARTGAEELIPYSDHAGFDELLALVDRSGAKQVDVVHGYAEGFARILADRGVAARAARERTR